jgi:hypothetical protein
MMKFMPYMGMYDFCLYSVKFTDTAYPNIKILAVLGCHAVVSYQRFEIAYGSHLQGLSSPRRVFLDKISLHCQSSNAFEHFCDNEECFNFDNIQVIN